MRKYGFSTYKVPEGVTEITAYAFEKVKITKVTFPATLKHIREYAFAETALTNLTLPNSFETIENHAFFNISSLKSLDLGGTINVGYSAFYYADHLTQVNLRPDLGRLAKIESSGFQAVPLTTITIPDSVTELGYFAFGGNKKLTKVHIGAGVRIFDLGAFDDGDAFGQFPLTLRELTVSAANPVYSADHNTLYAKRDDGLHLIRSYNSATASEYSVRKGTVQIAEKAFSGHKNLVKVILPEGLKRIGQKAFDRTKALTNVNFPESLEYVDVLTATGLREVEFGTHIREIMSGSFYEGMPERLIVRGGVNGKFTDSYMSYDTPRTQKSAYFGEGMTSVSYVYGVFPEYLVLPSTLKEFRLDGASGTGTGKVKVYVAAAPGTAAWNLVSVQMSKAGMDPARQLHSYTPLKAVLRHADKLVRGSKSPVTVEVSGGVEGRRQARILAVSPNGKTSVLHDWTDASQLPGTKAPTTAGRTTAAPSEVPTPADSQASTPAGGPTPSADPKGGNGSAYGFTAEITVPADGSALRLEARDETGYTFRTQ